MTATKLGIWLDHNQAHLTAFTTDPMKTTTIESKFDHQAKEEGLSKSENGMHAKEQHQQAEYYKLIAQEIRNYKEVILFGPTHAKDELLNTLRSNHLFSDIKIDVAQTDKMTELQNQAFVRKHFQKEHP